MKYERLASLMVEIALFLRALNFCHARDDWSRLTVLRALSRFLRVSQTSPVYHGGLQSFRRTILLGMNFLTESQKAVSIKGQVELTSPPISTTSGGREFSRAMLNLSFDGLSARLLDHE